MHGYAFWKKKKKSLVLESGCRTANVGGMRKLGAVAYVASKKKWISIPRQNAARAADGISETAHMH